jgi:hypothetical protein
LNGGYAEAADFGSAPADAKLLHAPFRLGQFRDVLKSSLVGYLQEYCLSPVPRAVAVKMHDEMPKPWHFTDFDTVLHGGANSGEQVSWAEQQVGFNALGQPVMIDYGARTNFDRLGTRRSRSS